MDLIGTIIRDGSRYPVWMRADGLVAVFSDSTAQRVRLTAWLAPEQLPGHCRRTGATYEACEED